MYTKAVLTGIHKEPKESAYYYGLQETGYAPSGSWTAFVFEGFVACVFYDKSRLYYVIAAWKEGEPDAKTVRLAGTPEETVIEFQEMLVRAERTWLRD